MAFEDLRDESAVLFDRLETNAQCCYQQLRLYVLIDVMESCHWLLDVTNTVWCSIADHQFCLLTTERIQDLLDSFLLGDVSLNSLDSIDRSDLLKIDRNHSRGGLQTSRLAQTVVLQAFRNEPFDDELRPRSRSGTDIDYSFHVVEHVVHLVDVHQLVGTSCSETVFLRFPIIYVLSSVRILYGFGISMKFKYPLIFGEFTHAGAVSSFFL